MVYVCKHICAYGEEYGKYTPKTDTEAGFVL